MNFGVGEWFGGILGVLMVFPLVVVAEDGVAFQVKRFEKNPMIQPSMKGAGSNICGPSVIRVPSWVEKPLGRYYMYFARHQSSSMGDAFIRLAYADSPGGPWTIRKGGSLQRSKLKDLKLDEKGVLRQSKGVGTAMVPARKKQHVASPDVHVDHKNRRIVMYFHGSYKGHNTGAAVSKDGIVFEDQDVNLGLPYLRVFQHRKTCFGVSPGPTNGSKAAVLRRLVGPFEVGDASIDLIPKDGEAYIRHAAVWHRGNQLVVFYSRKIDKPERIMASIVDLTSDDWKSWKAGAPIEVARPKFPYEGSTLPIQASKSGTAKNVHQLRDPCVFVDDDGKAYLYYAIKGEAGIAGGELVATGLSKK